jgi:hypothetical protein
MSVSGDVQVSARAQELAATFERANETVIAAIERCSDEQLRTVCDGEGWPVVVTAHHIALSYQPIADLARQIGTGGPVPPLTMEQLDQMNAEHARECANVSREETVALLRREAAAAAASVRGLSDEQLDRSAAVTLVGGEIWSAADMIERALIGHPADHGQSIQAALAG